MSSTFSEKLFFKKKLSARVGEKAQRAQAMDLCLDPQHAQEIWVLLWVSVTSELGRGDRGLPSGSMKKREFQSQ